MSTGSKPAGADAELSGISERIAKVWIGHAHIDDLITIGKEIDAAQAIIDGLRGEVAEMEESACAMLGKSRARNSALRQQRDQQAQRIGELEGVLGEMVAMIDCGDEPGSGSEWHKSASAILSARKEGAQ